MHDNLSKKFLWVTLFNLVITLVEFIGGLFSGSLALLSDAVHNLGDAGAIMLSFVAHLISRKKKNNIKTFGYKRAEILAAFTNAVVLIVICVFLVVEAVKRFQEPAEIMGNVMLLVSIVGLIGNFVSMLVMHADSKNNMNVKSTFLHMMSDALSSVGVIIAAVFIKFFGWVWLDPVITIVVAVLVLREAIKIVVESINVLMESNPDIDLEKIHQLVLEVPEVKNIHHVHVWRFSDEQIMMDAHINVDESLNVMELEEIYDKISKKLYNECTINHLTLQAEGERGLKEKMIEVKQND